jgi:hypothetical protein
MFDLKLKGMSEFLSTLSALEAGTEAIEQFRCAAGDVKSPMLRALITRGGCTC